jgi:hypothetical protein
MIYEKDMESPVLRTPRRGDVVNVVGELVRFQGGHGGGPGSGTLTEPRSRRLMRFGPRF